MSWIISSFFMFIFSIMYYLIVRYGQKKGLDRKVYMVANFVVPTALFYLLIIVKQLPVFPSLFVLAVCFFTALLLNYVGSIVAFVGMQRAPNAGLSVIITKSYALYTSILAIFLFHSPLTTSKFLAVVLIVICLGLVSFPEKLKANYLESFDWVGLSFLAFFCFGTASLIAKFIISGGVPTIVYLFWTNLFTSIVSIIDLIMGKPRNVRVSISKHFVVLLAIGISVSLFYFFKQIAEVDAPNIGYVNGINVASNVILTVLVALLLKDKLSFRKLAGVVGTAIGIVLLIM